MAGKQIIVYYLFKAGFLILCLSLPAWFHNPVMAGASDTLQKQFNDLKGAEKIAFLAGIARKELSGDPAFLKSAINNILANQSLLKQKGSLDSLYKLVKIL